MLTGKTAHNLGLHYLLRHENVKMVSVKIRSSAAHFANTEPLLLRAIAARIHKVWM